MRDYFLIFATLKIKNNRISNRTLESRLRLYSTNFKPDINEIMTNRQYQKSHQIVNYSPSIKGLDYQFIKYMYTAHYCLNS